MIIDRNSAYAQSLKAVLGFLKRSIDVHNGRGSSHSYSYWLNWGSGWGPAYPETTGYLIPTLLKAGQYVDARYELLAFQCADWLCRIQDRQGWFYAGVHPSNGPSIFNTAMIISGMTAAYRRSQDKRYLEAARRSVQWIMDQQEEDGSFRKYAFANGHFPAYYSRVLWSLASFDSIAGDENSKAGIVRLKSALEPHFRSVPIRDMGFEPNKPSFLHTIAYTLRGALESEKIKPDLALSYQAQLEELVTQHIRTGKWPGLIGSNGEGDYSFRCLTGEAQMAAILWLSKNRGWSEIAIETIDSLIHLQSRYGSAQGGLPGSYPSWGRYNPLRYPNWASKFLADALLYLLETQGEDQT